MKNRKVIIDRQSIQKTMVPKFKNYILDNDLFPKTLICYGGAGSGKSWSFIGQKSLFDCLNNRNVLIVRKVFNAHRKSTFSQIKQCLNQFTGMSQLFHIRQSDLQIKCINGKQITFIGLDDPQKIKSIVPQNGQWDTVIIQQASQLTLQEYNQVQLRQRGKTINKRHTILILNPGKGSKWINKKWIIQTPQYKNYQLLHSTYKDNPFIDQQYKQLLQSYKDIDEYSYKVYTLGQFVDLQGQIFTNYKIINELPNIVFDKIKCGLDFGYNNPSCYLQIALYDENVYILKQLYERKLTNTELIQKIKVQFEDSKMHRITADSAEPDRITEFKQKDFNIEGVKKTKNFKSDAIDWLKNRKIFIHKDCTNTIAQIEEYHWKKDREGNSLDTPVQINNHAIDALIYAIQEWIKPTVSGVHITGRRTF